MQEVVAVVVSSGGESSDRRDERGKGVEMCVLG